MIKDQPKGNSKVFIKTILWFVLAVLVGLMSYGVYITHPIKNFRTDTIIIWFILSIVFIPLGLLINKNLRQKYILKKSEKSLIGDSMDALSYSDFSGCNIINGDDLFGVFLVIVAVIFAWSAGVGFAILLIFVEFLLNFILDITPSLNSKNWVHTTAEVSIILYACYFIALSIINLFT